MNKKYVVYGLIGLLASGVAIALSIHTKQQTGMFYGARTEMIHHPGSGLEMSMPGMTNSSVDNPPSQLDEETTQVQLTISEEIAPNQSTPLMLEVQDASGQPITDFQTFQEKLMHLIVVQ